MDRKRKPGIYLLTDAGDAVELILVWLDGRETRLRGQSPAEELVSFVNFDFSAYRASVERLWEEHDVFEERVEVPYEDYVGFVRQALPWRNSLRRPRPWRIGAFCITWTPPQRCCITASPSSHPGRLWLSSTRCATHILSRTG